MAIVVFDARRSCEIRLDRATAEHDRTRLVASKSLDDLAASEALTDEARPGSRAEPGGHRRPGRPAALPDRPAVPRPLRGIDRRETVRTAIYLAWAADVAWQHSTLLGFRARLVLGREASSGWFGRSGSTSWPDPHLRRRLRQHAGHRLPAHRRPPPQRGPRRVRRAARPRRDRLGHDQRARHARPACPRRCSSSSPTKRPRSRCSRSACRPTPPDAAERTFDVRRRDLDPLDHVNNSVYLDYFEEALEAAGQATLLAALPAALRARLRRRRGTRRPAGRPDVAARRRLGLPPQPRRRHGGVPGDASRDCCRRPLRRRRSGLSSWGCRADLRLVVRRSSGC